MQQWKAHPWHGVSPGENAPQVVNAYIEIVPTDTVKYEVDKATGHLKVDRPQRYSSQCPTMYGFVPQTYCGAAVGAYSGKKLGRNGVIGDGDPLDICVLTEHPITHGDVLVQAVPIGGFRILDRGQADDKIFAVLKDDAAFGHWRSLADCPASLLDRLQHYFVTYKGFPKRVRSPVQLAATFGAVEAQRIIRLSIQDYAEAFLG